MNDIHILENSHSDVCTSQEDSDSHEAAALSKKRKLNNKSGHQATSNSMGNGKKKKRPPSKFVDAWTQNPLFKDWLQSRFNNEKNMKTAYCVACHSFETNGKIDLERHAKRPKHLEAIKKLKESKNETLLMRGFLSKSMDRKVAEGELRICTFIAENNLPFCLVDSLVPVLKKTFTDDAVLSKIQLGKQKCGNMIRQGTSNQSFLPIDY